ncbi:MAG: DEAD/DEAH box helicase [Schwartzia sp.]|nr:DEAD/DEAH box helicase [Schwartzia sp. (in: firmicutes)]
MLSEEEIRAQTNEASFERGCRYFRAGAVTDVLRKSPSYPPGEEIVWRGSVNGSGRAYNARITVRKDRVVDYGCTCPASELYPGACKHVVALMLEVRSEERRDPDTQPKRERDAAKESVGLSPTASRLFDLYELSGGPSAQATPQEAVRLVPRLVIESSPYGPATTWLEFRIGQKRLYVLRSITDFLRAAQNGETFEFGRELTFDPARHVFSDELSKALWQLITELWLDERSLRNYSSYFRSYGNNAAFFSGKRLRLSPTALARFLSAVRGKPFLVATEGVGEADGTVEDGCPPISVEVSDHAGDGRLMLLRRGELTFLTGDAAFVASGGTIYCVPPEKREALARVLSAFKNTRYIDIHRSRMGDFFGLVLPQMESVAEVRVAPVFSKRYDTRPFAAEVRLDYLGDGLAAEPVFYYGDEAFNPLAGAPPEEAGGLRLVRNIPKETEIFALFDRWGFVRENDRFVLADEARTYEFLTEGLPILSGQMDILYSDSFTRRPVRPMPTVTLGVSLGRDRLLEVTFEDREFDFDELVAILRSYRMKSRYHRLKDHTFLTLDDSIAELAELTEDMGLSRLRDGVAELPLADALYLDALARETKNLRLDVGRDFRELVRDIRNPSAAEAEPPASLSGVLRDYQKTAFRWLSALAARGLGGILADDMGLGKTLEVLSFLLSQQREDAPPSLVVAPTSLMYNWLDEIARFTPELRAVCVAGGQGERRGVLEEALASRLDVVITTYPLLRRDIESFAAARFRYVILDEAQYIKNPGTQAAKAVKRLRAESFLALTGTPIENSLTELWSIFDFLLPDYLGTHKAFRARYEMPIARGEEDGASESLRRHIAPFILRRLKKDVLSELPDKIESTLVGEMTPEQEKVYKAYFVQSRKELADELRARGFDASRIKILALLTRLRQIACDPGLFLEDYGGGSGKLDQLEELVQNAVAGGHRLLVFSQFTSMLARIMPRLEKAGIGFFYLDGTTPAEERLRLAKTFNAGGAPVFLISLKAGGTGLNLVGADMVVHCDPWWNPAVEEQAADRAHRIGQQSTVQVIKLLAKNTIEEKIFALQERKKALIDQMIRPGETFLSKLTEEEIRGLFA